MTSKLIVNTIESDSGISTITFNDDILVSGGTRISSTSISGVSTIGVTTAYITNANITNINNGPLSGTRNIVINGAMDINQRGWTGAAGTTTSDAYVTDRFKIEHVHDGVVSAGQTSMNSTIGGNAYADGFQNALILRVTTADASLAAGQLQAIEQRIEGFNLQGIKKGTANALPVTLSFWVRSTTIGTYIAELYDYDNTRQVSKAYTINAANTWEKKVLTFPADTVGAFDNDNALSFEILWWLAAGSSYSGGTLNTSWAAVTTANRAVGQTNLLATAGNNFWLTGVQLEVGSVATPFERRSYGQELALCQRYYQVFSNFFLEGYANGLNVRAVTVPMPFPVQMRATPTRSVITAGTFTNIRGSSTTYAGLGLWGLTSTSASASIEASAAGHTQYLNATEAMSAEL